MEKLTKEVLHTAAKKVGLLVSHDGKTIRSAGHAAGLTVDDALAWAGEIENTIRNQFTDVCRKIGMKHQQVEGAYAAGKKSGAFECADSLSQQSVEE